MPTDIEHMRRRMAAMNEAAGLEADPDAGLTGRPPRWAISDRWVEFECGCRAERCRSLVMPETWDPVIFRGLPEQAVYDSPCSLHAAEMNKYVKFGGFVDFAQWRATRRAILMGRVRP